MPPLTNMLAFSLPLSIHILVKRESEVMEDVLSLRQKRTGRMERKLNSAVL